MLKDNGSEMMSEIKTARILVFAGKGRQGRND